MTEDVLSPLIEEALSFTKFTKQKDICELIAKVTDASFRNPSCEEKLGMLQRLLSDTLTNVYNGKDWFQNFSNELNKFIKEI